MLRKSLLDLLLVCRKIKVAYGAASYELNDYDDGSYADFRLIRIESVSKLAILTQGFEVSIFSDEGQTIVRIYENYQEEY